MASDAHAHPYDLILLDSSAEASRRELGVACAASSWHEEEYVFNENLSAEAAADGAAELILCFGVHPQLPASPELAASAGPSASPGRTRSAVSLAFLEQLVAEKRLRAIGEVGFDLFNDIFRGTEDVQEALFRAQLDLARSSGLPMVLHLRRAMHKAFAHDGDFRRLPAVIFHSYSGTLREARALLKHGVNAFFSFGNTILLNHKRAMEACASLPVERLLFETDAPYQPRRGELRSSWSDLALIIEAAARLRSDSGSSVCDARELEATSDRNFRRAYGLD